MNKCSKLPDYVLQSLMEQRAFSEKLGGQCYAKKNLEKYKVSFEVSVRHR